jgi:hypothetical protein
LRAIAWGIGDASCRSPGAVKMLKIASGGTS